MSQKEKLRTEITKNNVAYKRILRVEIEAVGERKELFEEIRDAVNSIVEDA